MKVQIDNNRRDYYVTFISKEKNKAV